MISYYIISAIAVFFYMLIWYFLSLLRKRNDIVDIAWGLGFIYLAVFLNYFNGFVTTQNLFILILITIWGIRLAYHIFPRQLAEEDYRYQAFRKKWGKRFYWKSFLNIYMLQGALLLLVSAPVVASASYAKPFPTFFNSVGIIVWIVGFYFESISDAQLSSFKKDAKNKGKIMTSGLWKYTRHPNYFGEVTMWWGIWVIAFNNNISSWIALLGPVTITILVRYISGVPLLEEKYVGNKEFEEYKKRTSVFVPWFPKKK